MIATAMFPSLHAIMRAVASWFAPTARDGRSLDDEETRVRRAFVMEMMEECPEAFGHEDAFRCAMSFYSGRL